jgi:hypothetical protein
LSLRLWSQTTTAGRENNREAIEYVAEMLAKLNKSEAAA